MSDNENEIPEEIIEIIEKTIDEIYKKIPEEAKSNFFINFFVSMGDVSRGFTWSKIDKKEIEDGALLDEISLNIGEMLATTTEAVLDGFDTLETNNDRFIAGVEVLSRASKYATWFLADTFVLEGGEKEILKYIH